MLSKSDSVRRVALSWFPVGIRSRRNRSAPLPSPFAAELAEIGGESEVTFVADVHGLEVEVSVKVEHDADSSPFDHVGAEWVKGGNRDREAFRYGWRGNVEAVAVRARRGHYPDRGAFEACDLSGLMGERLGEAKRAGMARHAAWEWAKTCALSEYKSLERFTRGDWCYVGVTASVRLEVDGYESEIGHDSVWGVAYDPSDRASDSYLREVAAEVAAEAIHAARMTHRLGSVAVLVKA